jgi:hypothetical protein
MGTKDGGRWTVDDGKKSKSSLRAEVKGLYRFLCYGGTWQSLVIECGRWTIDNTEIETERPGGGKERETERQAVPPARS